MLLNEVLAEYLDAARDFEPTRYEVRNREERIQLDGRMWHLIHERDGGICWVCERGVPKGTGEIDHLVPRSSFLPGDVDLADRSWNLRLACIGCNQAKSNFRMLVLPRTVGVTGRCWDCTKHDEGERVELTEFAYCGTCGLTSAVPGKDWIL